MRRSGCIILLILAWISWGGTAWSQSEAGGVRLEHQTPPEGTEGHTPQAIISATFAGGRGGVNVGSVHIFLDDQEVTGQSVVTPQFFSYRPPAPLTAGVHRVRVTLADRAGTDTSHTWTFVVGGRSARIDRVTHNAADRPLGAGETLQVTVTGTPGGEVEVWVISAGLPPASLTAQETSPGSYSATLPVRAGDRPGEKAVLARLTAGGDRAYQAASRPVEFAGTPHALQPKVVNPSEGQRVGASFLIQGQTQPRAKVRIRASADASLFGAVAIRQDIADEQVQADGRGQFSAQIATGSLLGGSRVRVELTATSADGRETSPPTLFSVVRE